MQSLFRLPLGQIVIRAALAGTIAAALGVTAQAQIIQNPGFETPVVGDGASLLFTNGQTIGAGWFVAGTDAGVDVLDKNFTGGGVTWYKPKEGNQYLYLGVNVANSTLVQDISLLNTSYTLKFDQADFATPFLTPGGLVTVDLIAPQTLVSILGGPQTFTTPEFSDFITRTIDFTLPAAGTYRLKLSSSNGHAAIVDNFLLTQTGIVAAAPEPGSLALLALAGLPVMGLLPRKRN